MSARVRVPVEFAVGYDVSEVKMWVKVRSEFYRRTAAVGVIVSVRAGSLRTDFVSGGGEHASSRRP